MIFFLILFVFVDLYMAFFSGKKFFYENDRKVEKDIHCRLHRTHFLIRGGAHGDRHNDNVIPYNCPVERTNEGDGPGTVPP